MKENILIDKSIAFAARIIRLQNHLVKNKKEAVISKQIIRSGTSIGANINEANYGQSKADFISKMHIALKETAETEYWIKLLNMSEYIDDKISNCTEIDDVFEKFTEYKESGLFEIKTFHSVSDKELDFVYNDFKKTINEYSLRYYPDNPMSKFIMAHFPKVWFE